jgi:hypothetical protein
MRKISSRWEDMDKKDQENFENAIGDSEILQEENVKYIMGLDKNDPDEAINKAVADNMHNPFQVSPDDGKIRLNLFDTEERGDEIQSVLDTISSANIDGFSDKCFNAAEAIMEFFFEPDEETYTVAYLNKFLYEYGIIRGHAAVYRNGAYIDSDGRIKSEEEIESWGMIDEGEMDLIIDDNDLQEELEFIRQEDYSSKLERACYETIMIKNISESINIDEASLKLTKKQLKDAEIGLEAKKAGFMSKDNRINKIASLNKTSSSMRMLVPNLKCSNELKYHIDNNIKLASNIFRVHSGNFLNIFNEARSLWKAGSLSVCEEDEWLLQTDIGKTAILNGQEVMLDLPIEIDDDESYVTKIAKERKVKLNSPRRIGKNDPGYGRKKFIVHVKNPSTGNIKTVTFGDPNLSIKANNPARRKSFLARHNCDSPGPKTSAKYWSCNLHRYKKQLGLKFEGRW